MLRKWLLITGNWAGPLFSLGPVRQETSAVWLSRCCYLRRRGGNIGYDLSEQSRPAASTRCWSCVHSWRSSHYASNLPQLFKSRRTSQNCCREVYEYKEETRAASGPVWPYGRIFQGAGSKKTEVNQSRT